MMTGEAVKDQQCSLHIDFTRAVSGGNASFVFDGVLQDDEGDGCSVGTAIQRSPGL
jgi:hypothetical protein